MKVGLFDLEMTNLHADFGFLICGCIYDYGGEKMQTFSLDCYPNWRKNLWNDCRLACEIRNHLEKFDIIVGYNSQNFDITFLNTRLLYHKKAIVQAGKHIDMFRLLKWKVRTHNLRLDTLAQLLSTKQKTPLRGEIWTKATCGHRPSIQKIVDHCEADVLVLLEVYEQTKQFITFIK